VFDRLAGAAAQHLGSAWFFALNVAIVLLWGAVWWATGRPDGLQIAFINILTITTWLLLILVQRSQLRDTSAMELKLDELLRAVREARSDLIGLEEADEQRVEAVKHELRDAPGAPDPPDADS
jgi:low affinity Fe/Cu permease